MSVAASMDTPGASTSRMPLREDTGRVRRQTLRRDRSGMHKSHEPACDVTQPTGLEGGRSTLFSLDPASNRFWISSVSEKGETSTTASRTSLKTKADASTAESPANSKVSAPAVDAFLHAYKTPISATTASLISTLTGFPLDSLKSRLQSTRGKVSLWGLGKEVIRDEGVSGLWRGAPLPLASIAVVRTISFTIYTDTKDFVSGRAFQEPLRRSSRSGSSTRPETFGSHSPAGFLTANSNIANVALTSSIAGAASGAIVTLGSCPFELVKVRRQLEFQIARDRAEQIAFIQGGNATAATKLLEGYKPPGTIDAVKDIFRERGIKGLWTGFNLHARTAAYFAEYDVIRYLLGRDPVTDKQGPLPSWAKGWLPVSLVPFLAGSFAGVTSWMVVYPLDVIKTKTQQRVLSGQDARPWGEQMSRLVRGPDPNNPKPLLVGLGRLYRGLGVSVVRSIFTHGLLWTIVDATGKWIDTKPAERWVS